MVQRSEDGQNCQLTYVKKCFPGKCVWNGQWTMNNGEWTIDNCRMVRLQSDVDIYCSL